MAALDPTPAEAFAPPRANAVVASLAMGVAALWRSFIGRREIGRLAQMSDHELADIGLERGDLRAARRAPLHRDPTSLLSGIVQERDGCRIKPTSMR